MYGYRDVGIYQEDIFEKIEMMIISRRLPVYVFGRGGGEGHAWVIDGILKRSRDVEIMRVEGHVLSSYTEKSILYHCNFGWKGKCDGFYFGFAAFGPHTYDAEISDTFHEWESPTDNDYTNRKRIICYNLPTRSF